eukprot:1462774-Pyramimonas_sp.AAC.1
MDEATLTMMDDLSCSYAYDASMEMTCLDIVGQCRTWFFKTKQDCLEKANDIMVAMCEHVEDVANMFISDNGMPLNIAVEASAGSDAAVFDVSSLGRAGQIPGAGPAQRGGMGEGNGGMDDDDDR